MRDLVKKMQRIVAFILMVCIVMSGMPLRIFGNESAHTGVSILNSDFELTSVSDGKSIPRYWSAGDNAEVVSGGINGSNCLKITNTTPKNTFVEQTITLEPNTEYILTGYIKGQNISDEEFTDGAFIGLEETGAYTVDQYNNWKHGTFGWTKVTVYFKSSSRGQATIRCALGHYWGGNTGTAYFDNIEITKGSYPGYPITEKVKFARDNITVYMDENVVNQATTANYNKWVDDLQKAYESYAELTGGTPFNGDNLAIINTGQPVINRYGGIGNFNPILLPKDFALAIKNFNDTGDNHFGVLHEMGHSFDNIGYNDAKWVFDSELMANFKMAYVLEKIQGVVYMDYNWGPKVKYVGADIINYYKLDYEEKMKPSKQCTGDGLTYLLLKVKDKISWEPFKKTFSDIRNGSYDPVTSLNKFDLFLAKLQEYYNPDGTEVYDVFTKEELDYIRQHYRSGADVTLDNKKSSAVEEIQNYYGDYTDRNYEVNVNLSKIIRKINYAINSEDVTKQLAAGKELIDNNAVGIKYTSLPDNESAFQPFAFNGQLSGSQNEGKIIDGLSISMMPAGNIQYRAFLKGRGWSTWKNDGESLISKTNEIETIQIRLTGEFSGKYDVYYRTHNRYYGWLGWTKNGSLSGSYDKGSAIEGYEVRLVKKGIVVDGITNDNSEAFKTDDSNFPDLVTTIYYKGYENPYIHYCTNGIWTSVPGIKMAECTDVEGYTHKAEINLGNDITTMVCFNDGKGNWDNNNGKNYSFGAGYYTYSNGRITKIAKPEKKLKILSVTSSVGNEFVEGVNVIFRVETANNTGDIKYKFLYNNKTTGQSGTFRDYTTSGNLSWIFGTPGKYVLTVLAKDDVSVAEETFEFEVKKYEEFKVTSVRSSLGDRFELGNTTMLSVNTEGGKGYNRYAIKVNDEYIMSESEDNTIYWTPEQAGTYLITGYARETQGVYLSYSKTIIVEEKPQNTTTIYYKGYDNPYIHYGIDGVWTGLPGVKMEACTDIEGYAYKAVIPLGDSTSVSVCFNDGNGNWDNNNEKNYVFGSGNYTYSAGKITKILVPEQKGNKITIYYKGYDNPYIHYGIDDVWTSIPGIKMEKCYDMAGYTHKAEIYIGEKTSVSVCFNDGNGNWDNNNKMNYTFGIGRYTYTNGRIEKIGS